MVTTIADPAPDTTIAPLPPLPTRWLADALPGVVADATMLGNMLRTGNPCVTAPPIAPMGVHSAVAVDKLEPLKLYTATFKVRYKTASQSVFSEEEVHRYVFQTSRYGSFEEQINSYILERNEADPQEITKTALFEVPVVINNTQIAKAKEVLNGSLDENSSLKQEYAYDYDKLISGIFKLGAMHPAMTTEFNVIRREDTGVILGILLRSPEPFNDPKMPDGVMTTTIQAQSGSTVLNRKLFSKDKCTIFLTNDNMLLTLGTYDFQFSYLLWSGDHYEEEANVSLTIELTN